MAGKTVTKTVGDKLGGMSVQTSLLGQPIPIGWGRGRLSCNLIDYLDWKAIPHTKTKTSSGGGKGGGGSVTKDTTYTYSASVVIGLCEGPISAINAVYKDAASFTGAGALGASGLSVALGTYSQTPWAYLTSLFPSHALSYRGIAYTYAQGYDLGTSGGLANHSFEIDFAIQLNSAGGIHDADPKDILTDFLTNSGYGVPGWSPSLNGDWSNYSLYCRANNLLLSPVLDQQNPATDTIRRWLDITHSDCVFSEGVLKIVPYGDASATANGVTWTPNLTPVYDLTERDFLGEVEVEIADQSDSYNSVSVEFLDRSNEYRTAVEPAYDLNNILTFGLRKDTSAQTWHEICDLNVARDAIQLYLQRQLYVRDTYHFDLPQDFVGLEPLDFVTLTTTVDGMKLNRQLVMISQIDEAEDGSDVLSVTAEGWVGTAGKASYGGFGGAGYGPGLANDPGNVAAPLLFIPPGSLVTSATGYEAWAAVASTNPDWGGCFVWASFDNTNYTRIGTINAPARYGTVYSSSYPAGADPDTTDTLNVDLTVSGGALSTFSNAQADGAASLCLVDNELIAYSTATLSAANKYALGGYVRRGLGDTAIASHAVGANFVRLDDAIFKYPFAAQYTGKTLYLKFQSFNLYGRQVQDISTLTAYTLALAAVTTAPSAATSTAEYRSTFVRWTNPTDNNLLYVQVLASTTNSVGTATVVGRSITGEYTHQNLTPGTTWYYWVQAVYRGGATSSAVSAGNAVPLSIALYEGIGADNILAPAEKQEIIREFAQLANEKTGLDSQATNFGITTEKTAYDNAYSTLNTYLTGLSPAYTDTTQNTTITRATWNTNWSNLYSARQTLLNKIDSVAATQAQWPNITDTTGTMPDPNATNGDGGIPDDSFDATSGLGGGGFGVNWTRSGGAVFRTVIP